MAQRSMFFDAVSGDRSYDATAFAALLRSLVQRDGVVYGYGGGLAVTATDPASMNVTVATGAAFVQGRMFEVHTAGETLAISAADPTNPRIDRIVVKLDNSSAVRSVSLAVKAGTPAASPTPPALQRDGTVWELSLAQVYVAAGATSISSANLTDERDNETVCGYSPRTPDIVHRGTQSDRTGVSSILDTLLAVRIVDKATNANGTYVCWENGLQICWSTYSVSATQNAWVNTALTFPAAFASTPVVLMTSNTGGYRVYLVALPSATGYTGQVYNMDLTTTINVNWLALGLWK